MPIWAVAAGLVATVIVAGGPRAVGLADRVAVPALALSGIVMTIACLRVSLPQASAPLPAPALTAWFRGFDITAGYQVTWLLMFADYTRYTAKARAGGDGRVSRARAHRRLVHAARIHRSVGGRIVRPGRHDLRRRSGLVGCGPRDAGDTHHELRQHLHVSAGAEEPAAGRRATGPASG